MLRKHTDQSGHCGYNLSCIRPVFMMRLLHSKHLTFTSFADYESIPRYAILSHVWEADEVTYKEMNKSPDKAMLKKGYQKIKACAQQALKDGFDYFWIDTCCIDKSSSSELSEAINSMFQWYRDASICYAHLYDVPALHTVTNQRSWTAQFQSSRWFTRGWTLQELIAPKSLQFYSRDWIPVGSKMELASAITEGTGIPYDVVVSGDFSKSSLAQRMSWAARRSTSRREDTAYCLMGLFDVNIPMLYGEGDRAFLRLQEEIIKRSDDLSIFSWVSSHTTFSSYRGLLARSVSDFAQCNDIEWARGASNEPFQATNKGIHISLPLLARHGREYEYTALLRGVYKKPHIRTPLGIFLKAVGEEQYARVESNQLAFPQMKSSGGQLPMAVCKLFVRQNVFMELPNHTRVAGISLRLDASVLELVDVQPLERWNGDAKFFSLEAPIALRKPPKAVFTLRPVGRGGSAIRLTVDPGSQWGSVLGVDKEWNSSPAITPFTHKFHCRKPQQPVMEVLAERGIFNGEAKIILSITTLN